MNQVFPLRVYYEDTDFSGRVYHASYLRFLERGRTEWMRALGFEHRALASASGVVFAVRGLRIEYLAPALIDDALVVETKVAATRGAILIFDQRILRGGSRGSGRSAAQRSSRAATARFAGAARRHLNFVQLSIARSSRSPSETSRSAK